MPNIYKATAQRKVPVPEGTEIETTTAKGILFVNRGHKEWAAKSQCEINEEGEVVAIPLATAKALGWVETIAFSEGQRQL